MARKRVYVLLAGLVVLAVIGAIVVRVFLSDSGVLGLSRIYTAEEDDDQLLRVQVSPDGTMALVDVNASDRDSVRLYSTANNTVEWQLFARNVSFPSERHMLGFTPDSAYYILTAVNEEENVDVLWYINTESGSIETNIDLQAGEEALAGNNDFYATGSDATLTVYERESGAVHFQHEFDRQIDFARFTPNGEQILVAHGASAISGYNFYLIDLDNPQVDEPTFTGENLSTIDTASVLISGDGRYLAFAIINGVGLFVIDLQTHDPVYSIFGDQLSSELVSSVRFDAFFGFLNNNTHFAYMSNEGIVYAVDLATGAIVDDYDPGLGTSPISFSVSADGSRLAIVIRDTVSFWRN